MPVIGRKSKRMTKSSGWAAGFLVVLVLLLAPASGSYAETPCQDCHGVTGPHAAQCRDTTCGVSCHTAKLDTIMHPSGEGTPMVDTSTPEGMTAACDTCHQSSGAISVTHPFRINTDPAMTTIYPDLDQTCGQCHGGGTDSVASPPATGVAYLSKNQLSLAAQNIHSADALNNADCLACHDGSILPAALSHPTDTGAPGTGASACKTCHFANDATLHQNAPINTDRICSQCHGPDGTAHLRAASISIFSSAIHGGSVLSTTCADCHTNTATSHTTHASTHTSNSVCRRCHTRPGVSPSSATMALCTGCHTDKSMTTINHVSAGFNCTSCHQAGVKPVAAEITCVQCHTLDAFRAGSVVDRFTTGIHTPDVTADFSVAYSTTTPKLVTFTNIGSSDCTNPTWSFGNGSTGSGSPVDNQYGSSVTAVPVTMTCGDLITSVTKTVYPRAIFGLTSGATGSTPTLPAITPALSVLATAGSYTVTISDSTDYGVYSDGTGSVKIAWGDGVTETYAKGSGPWAHLYPRARKYSAGAVVTLKPNGGYAGQLVRSPKMYATIGKIGITGTVTSSPTVTAGVNNERVVLTLKAYYSYGTSSGMRILKKTITSAEGAYIFQDVLPISALQKITGFQNATEYQIEARKMYGRTRTLYNFEWGTSGPMPAIVTVGTGTATVTPNINITGP